MPAICAGLAAGSKYTYGLVLLPVILAIWLFMERNRRLEATLVAVAAAALSFLAVVPYSVVDLPAFLNGLAREATHYATVKHPNDTGSRAIDKLIFYASYLSRDFGIPGIVLALIGLTSAAVSDWRRTLTAISFPAALLAVLSAQQVQIVRNILPIFPLVAAFVGVGILFLHERFMRIAIVRRINLPIYKRAISSTAFLGLFLLGVCVPLGRISTQIEVTAESRLRAVNWIQQHVAMDTTIIVPRELQFDIRPLVLAGYSVQVMQFKPLDTAESIDSLMAGISGPTIVLVPRWKATGWGPNYDTAKEKARALNVAADRARLETLADFSIERGVLVNFSIPANGNPGFSIARW